MAQQVKVKLGFISWEPQKGLVHQEWGWGGGGTHKWQNHSISISFFVALLLEGLSKGLSNGANKDKEEKEEDAGNSAEDHSHTEVGLVEAEQLPENLMLQTNNPVDIPIMRRALSNVIRAVCQNPKKKAKVVSHQNLLRSQGLEVFNWECQMNWNIEGGLRSQSGHSG